MVEQSVFSLYMVGVINMEHLQTDIHHSHTREKKLYKGEKKIKPKSFCYQYKPQNVQGTWYFLCKPGVSLQSIMEADEVEGGRKADHVLVSLMIYVYVCLSLLWLMASKYLLHKACSIKKRVILVGTVAYHWLNQPLKCCSDLGSDTCLLAWDGL